MYLRQSQSAHSSFVQLTTANFRSPNAKESLVRSGWLWRGIDNQLILKLDDGSQYLVVNFYTIFLSVRSRTVTTIQTSYKIVCYFHYCVSAQITHFIFSLHQAHTDAKLPRPAVPRHSLHRYFFNAILQCTVHEDSGDLVKLITSRSCDISSSQKRIGLGHNSRDGRQLIVVRRLTAQCEQQCEWTGRVVLHVAAGSGRHPRSYLRTLDYPGAASSSN